MPIAGRYLPYKQGYNYGMGVVATTGMRANHGLEEAPATGVTGAVGGHGDFKLTRIETTEDLESVLGISADATAGCGLWEVNPRFKFSSSCKIHAQCITLIVTQTINFGFEQIDTPRLSAEARSVVDHPDTFQARYGDLFVSGIGTGGLFVGVVIIEYHSEQSRQDIDTALSGRYGLVFDGDAAVNLQKALQKTNSRAEISVYNEGGTLLGHERPMNPSELLDAYSSWYNSIVGPDGHGTDLKTPYIVQVLPYSVAEGPEPPNSADLQKQLDVLARCANMRSNYMDDLNLVSYMIAKGEQYDYVDGTAAYLQSAQTSLAKDLQHIAETASHAKDHPGQAQWPEVYNAPPEGYAFTVLDPTRLPKLKASMEVTVPDLTMCTSESAARKTLTDVGLILNVITDNNQEADFKVLAQQPPATTKVPSGSVVGITVPKAKFNALMAKLRQRGDLVRLAASSGLLLNK